MAENKTKPTNASVKDYLAERASDQQRRDCRALMAMLRRVTGKSPKMWGPSIVGYGGFEYTSASGRRGQWPLAAFAIRGRDLVVYLLPDADGQKELRARLGKHSMGKSCLYFRQLADLDTKVLEQLVTDSMEQAMLRHGKN